MTTEIAESLNNVDQKARLMPVGFLLEWLRGLLQDQHARRRDVAEKMQSKLAKEQEDYLKVQFDKALVMTVHTLHFSVQLVILNMMPVV